jgi:hypothetical protein
MLLRVQERTIRKQADRFLAGEKKNVRRRAGAVEIETQRSKE